MAMPDFEGMRAWARGMWNQFERASRMPRPNDGENLLKQLSGEAELIDLFRRYHYMYDSGNVEGMLDSYTADAIVMNPRGTYIGREALRENFEFLVDERRFIMHHGTNPLVRFEQDWERAWLTAFYWCIELPKGRDPAVVGGTYVSRVRKEADGVWRVFEQRITINYGFALSPVGSALGQAPEPTLALGSHDLIESTTVL